MRIVSTNTGLPKTIEWRGKQVTTGIYKYPVDQPVYLDREDVENDHVIDRKYHGGTDKACYLYASGHYVYWQALYPGLEMPWGMFGENLTVEGLQEDKINIGDIFRAGDAVVQATQPRQPCFKLEFRFGNPKIVKQFVESGFSGVYVRVLQPGHVKSGDTMVLEEKGSTLTIHQVYDLLYTDQFREKEVRHAVDDPFIAKSCRRDLLKRWGNLL